MPEATYTISGEIEDFSRIDNLFKTLKREGAKLLENWTISVQVSYTEKEGEKAVP